MKLTKEELIKKLMAGEKLYAVEYVTKHYCYFDASEDEPFVFYDVIRGVKAPMSSAWSETEWETYKEKPEWWTPKDGEKAWYVTITGDIIDSCMRTHRIDRKIIGQGNVFKTKEEAKKEAELREAKYRVKKRIWELNGGEFIGFKNDSNNWSFELREGLMVADTWSLSKFHPNWQYLKSDDLVKQLIEEMRDDLLLIRGE